MLPGDVAAHFAVAPHQKVHSVCGQSRRMRLSVRSNARRDRRMRLSVECAFPHLGKRGGTSRKSALCADALTQKRILCRRPHGKAHSAPTPSWKSALCAGGVTKRRILDGRRDAKAHSVPAAHEKAHFGPRPQIAPHGKTALCILCMLCAASHRVSDLSLG